MTTAAIICEYNPFHNGHKHQIDLTRELTGADFIVCIMSGNYVQRGEPAILNKWARARSALMCGADLIIELPCLYATASADYFSAAAVDIINKLGVIDYLSFGSDSGDLELLSSIAQKRATQPEGFIDLMIKAQKAGLSYPKAIKHIYNDPDLKSNDILAVQYITALYKSNSLVKPVTIKRIGSQYSDTTINSTSPSAQSIRNYVRHNKDLDYLYSVMPNESVNILKEEFALGRAPVTFDSFSNIMMAILRSLAPEGISCLPHVSSGLEYKLFKNAVNSCDISELIDKTVSPMHTRSRIQRLCLSSMLGIKHNMLSKNPDLPYVRILGFRKRAIPILKLINDNCRVPVIMQVASGIKNLSDEGKSLISLEIKSTDIYVLGYHKSSYSIGGQDYTQRILIFP